MTLAERLYSDADALDRHVPNIGTRVRFAAAIVEAAERRDSCERWSKEWVKADRDLDAAIAAAGRPTQ